MFGIIISIVILLLLAIIYRALDWLPAIVMIILKIIGIFLVLYIVVACVYVFIIE